ncbi:hypothetical protein BFW01_g9266 [Lasiodiplodia theobromae]|uniref:Uncharacterized protein n=1 Tax=Lasiodiplodia theobromae TaxID=45133 RepID=A0A5N5DJZ4_9PEZI|nr:uncharacterized protein LTHEOB_10273 [Lasiodiplodia theobromae]KAB2577910.1 hypothetical protein DBV05_g3306 [Lasiodiplodia theobromae]KAF4539341.1 hypothetical protein LTHEOB_10273 [Lasiodiplodia theobromae]KAF9638369.1 hypothetical protein BFW01_g9266 [Lasiodiplodia theobromae]
MPSTELQKQTTALRKSHAKSAAPAVAASRPSAYEIMAARIANRVAEMAENMTFIERPQAAPAPAVQEQTIVNGKKQPRKLEIRLQNSAPDQVSFSAPFLDNTLSKMLALQNRMLQLGSELSKDESISEEIKKEQFAQSAELSRVIALICAEKARQGG